MTYVLEITETSRRTLKGIGNDTIFNVVKDSFPDKEAVKEYLQERYGSFRPERLRRIYIDKNNEAVEAGYIRSYWNRDVSHDSRAWYQTDWISVYTQELKPVML